MRQANKIITQIQDDKNYQQNNESQVNNHNTHNSKFTRQTSFKQTQTLTNVMRSLCRCFKSEKVKPEYSPFEIKNALQVPDQTGRLIGLKTLILDLDETLVHSSFQPIQNPQIQFNIILNGADHQVFVRVRPGAQNFLKLLSLHYEIIVFTASLSEYANPVIDFLDPDGVVTTRLFRENCTHHNNVFVKDLSLLNRQMRNIILVDNSCNSFMFQPMNAFHIKDFFEDMKDQELYLMIPFFKILKDFHDVRQVQEWWYKFVNGDKLTYTNVSGQRTQYQIKEEDFYYDPMDMEPIKKHQDFFSNLPGLCKSAQSMEENDDAPVYPLVEYKQSKESTNDTPMTNIQTPKAEERLSLFHPRNKKQTKKHNSILISRNNHQLVIQDLDERVGTSTERHKQSSSIRRLKIKDTTMGLQDSQDGDYSTEIRQQWNINSPKELEKNTILFFKSIEE